MIKTKLEKILAYGIYLWIFLLPWQTRYFYKAEIAGGIWEAGNVSIYLSEIILIFLLMLNFILWTGNKSINKYWFKHIKLTSPILWLLIFVIFTFISIKWSVFPALSIYYGLKLMLALGIIWLITIGKISFRRVAFIIVVSGLIQGLLAISQFLNQLVWGTKWLGVAWQDPQNLGVSVVDSGYRRWLRAYGAFPHPNVLGGFLDIIMVFLFYLYGWTERLWQSIKNRQLEIFKIVLLFSLIIIFSGILLSFSRAAWLSVVLFLFVIFFQQIVGKSFISWPIYIRLFFIIFLTSLIWISVYTEPFLTRVKADERLEQLSFTQRVNSFTDAWQSVKQKPFLGTGIGVYTYNLHQLYPERYVWQLQPPHNTFLLILVELGIVGLILFLLFLGMLFIYVRQNPFFLLLFTVIIFLMLFDHWWWSLNMGWYLLFTLFALSDKSFSLVNSTLGKIKG